MKNQYCPYCGNTLREQQKFCNKCGAKLIKENNNEYKKNKEESLLDKVEKLSVNTEINIVLKKEKRLTSECSRRKLLKGFKHSSQRGSGFQKDLSSHRVEIRLY